MKKSSAFST